MNPSKTISINNLLKIQPTQWQDNEVLAVDARALHSALNIGREFAHWIKARLSQAQFIEHLDYETVRKSSIDLPKLANQNDENLSIDLPKLASSKGGDLRSVNYWLSLDTAKHICLMERKNPIAHAIRQHFIDSEKTLAVHLPMTAKRLRERTQARINTIEPQERLNKAVQQWETRHNKDTAPHHYSRESELINSLVLGENVRKWKARHGIKQSPREVFNTEQLELTQRLIELNCSLLDLDMPYQDRKQHLSRYVTRYERGL